MSIVLRSLTCASALFLGFSDSAPAFAAAQQEAVGRFALELGQSAGVESFSGDVIVAFSDGRDEPREAMHRWFGAPPVMRFVVEGWKTGETLELSVDDAVAQHPVDWRAFDWNAQESWSLQAICRRSLTGREAGLGTGDLFSAVVTRAYAPGADDAARLVIDQVVLEDVFEETERVKLFEFTSPSLSRFHGFDYTMLAGVLLPVDYDPDATYPVLYSITGFGGTHHGIHRWVDSDEPSFIDECIVVIPDASNRYGHSVFCNSPSIGPWGDALVHELIPALEAHFGGAGPEHRHVTGVSSGGWSSFWLQVAYPEAFAACWSHVPDPIDFHDFQQINLYEQSADGTTRNMYVDEAGAARPVARGRDGEVMLTYEEFVRREHVLGPGGQIRSFEATFSLPMPDGTPTRVFDVETGEVHHAVAETWRAYDISHTLLTNWDALESRLDGRIHVWAGEIDNFYLEGAVQRFRALAEPLGLLDHMTVDVVPGLTHSRHGPGFDQMLKTMERGWVGRGEERVLEAAGTE